MVLKVDLQNGSIVSSIKPKSSTILDGFVEFDALSSSALTGLAGARWAHWIIHFDPRGEHSLRYRCKIVNVVEKTVKGVLSSSYCLCRARLSLLLFASCSMIIPPCVPCRYSVFTVLSIHVPAKVFGDNPVIIHIEAAIDNANEDDDLPRLQQERQSKQQQQHQQ
jgi:hypothetical protein